LIDSLLPGMSAVTRIDTEGAITPSGGGAKDGIKVGGGN